MVSESLGFGLKIIMMAVMILDQSLEWNGFETENQVAFCDTNGVYMIALSSYDK